MASPIDWKLGALLEERNLTAYALATRMDMYPATIYNLAKQKRITRISTKMLAALCDALDCSPGALLVIRGRE